MARSINSPGVQIIETDLSLYQQIGGATTVFVPGFAPQGPIDEVLLVTSISEFERIYGAPTNSAERYFYHSSKEILNSSATLLTTRVPYGSGFGEGFTSQYSGLFYPAASSVDLTSPSLSGKFTLGSPVYTTLTEEDYNNIIQNNVTWNALPGTLGVANYNKTTRTITAGMVILNAAQTTINEGFEGYYVAIADNTGFGPNTDFNAVNFMRSLTGENAYFNLPATRLGFALSGTQVSVGSNSVSEVIESVPTYNFSDAYYNDSLVLTVLKVRNSIYEPQILTFSVAESFIGSLDATKKTVAPTGGIKKSFYLEDLVNSGSSNIKMFVNPDISQKTNWADLNSVNPAKFARTDDSVEGLYPLGVWAPSYRFANDKNTGNLITKLERALTHIESTENVTIDVVIDAGLSTIFANSSGSYYDDTIFRDTSELSNPNSNTIQRWRSLFNVFNNFVTNTRKDCVFISDPLRQIFVNGENSKILSLRDKTFSTDIYTPLKNCFESINTNYAATYANWVKNYDPYSDKDCWLPSSGYAAAVFARTDTIAQPWIAPAGLNRGLLNNIVDIAFNPNQKQRDFLYTIAMNPIVLFPGDGYTIFGQKTLQNKPSAFDRINVRRLFLTLERAVQRTIKYFVFEPNTEFTRTRVRNTITPVFELAKNTEGLYDYLIVCDERNNTPDVIDRNELSVDIYIKPVKAAEFILVNFIATRTGQNFEELI